MADDLSDVNAVIGKNMAAFDKPGVLSVRPGFKVTKDWLTNTRSIVVTVRHKVAHPPEGEMLPAEVGGVPVDVRQASPAKALELEDPRKYAAGLRLAPDQGSVPHFPDEQTLAGTRPAAAASAHAQLAAIAKPELTYSGPPGVTLDPVEAQATITLSASPDAGWPTLKAFLAGTAETLTVGLYDFTSAHVAKAVTDSLTGIFEDYIRNDLQIASGHNTPPEAAGPPLTPPPLGSTETPAFREFFPAVTVTGVIKIVPLLTPDPGVYAGAVSELIASATRTLYMQFQYIEPPKAGDPTAQPFTDLINAVIDRQAHGVDVRIILRDVEKVGYLEQLRTMGLDVVTCVKIQKNVHNKGIVVDGARVLVSSQNWSADGTLRNRDAGVIIYHQDAAQYFQRVFLHDWENLAAAKAVPD